MNKLFSIIVFSLFISYNLIAGKKELFFIDEALLNQEFCELNELDQYLEKNNYTLLELTLFDDCALNRLNDFKNLSNIYFNTDSVKQVWGIPGFWWGFVPGLGGTCTGLCCFYAAPVGGAIAGLAGILVVYNITENKQETFNSTWGCIIGNVIGSGILFTLSIFLNDVFLY